MNLRDPDFTARLERALTILANQPTRPLHYLEDRFELETGELQAWLDEYNGGQKALKFSRIHEVKRELSGQPAHKQETKPAPASPAANPFHTVPPGAPEAGGAHDRPKGERQEPPPLPPIEETPAEAARRERMQRAGAKPKTARPVAPAAKDDHFEFVRYPSQEEPTLGEKSLTPVARARGAWSKKRVPDVAWIPVVRALLEKKLKADPACAAAGLSRKTWDYKQPQLLAARGLKKGQLRELLALLETEAGGARCAPAAPVDTNVNSVDTPASEGDAVSALISLGRPAGQARRLIESTVAAHGLPETTAELVKLALRHTLPFVAKPEIANKRAPAKGEPRAATRSRRCARSTGCWTSCSGRHDRRHAVQIRNHRPARAGEC